MLEDEIWLLTQKLNDVTEYRLDIRTVWNDEAAFELNGRYLDPLESDAQMLLTELNLQMQYLEQVNANLKEALQLAVKADTLSRKSAQYLKEAYEMSLKTYTHLDLSTEHNTVALETIPKVYELISQANKIC